MAVKQKEEWLVDCDVVPITVKVDRDDDEPPIKVSQGSDYVWMSVGEAADLITALQAALDSHATDLST